MSDTQVTVTVTFVPVDSWEESGPTTRCLTLSQDNPTIPLGRSSKRDGRNREPASQNGWFDSRVMSRVHAELSIAPERKDLYIRDSRSLHGTWLNNLPLIPDEKTPLLDGDTIRFGVNVERGVEEFPALSFRCMISWSENEAPRESSKPGTPELKPVIDNHLSSDAPPSSSRNTFSVPEDDSDEDEDENQNENEKDQVSLAAGNFDEPGSAPSTSSIRPVSRRRDSIGLEDEQPSHLNCQWIQHSVYPWTRSLESERASTGQQSEHEDMGSEDSDDESYIDEDDLESPKETSSHTSENEVVPDQDELVEKSGASDDDLSDENHESSESDEDEFIDPRVLAPENIACPQPPSPAKFTFMNGGDDPWVDNKLPRSISPIKSSVGIRLPPLSDSYDMSYRSQSSLQADKHGRLASPCFDPHRTSYTDGPFAQWNSQSYSYAPPPIPIAQYSLPKPCVHSFESIFSETHKDDGEAAHGKGAPPTSSSRSLKRKASEIESEDVLQDAQVYEKTPPVPQKSGIDSISQSEVVSAITSALSEAGEPSESEPPAKRIKAEPSSSSTNLAGYTATAVISALLGGLGTIALLAALPAEYFQ